MKEGNSINKSIDIKELQTMITVLESVFDIVRLVDSNLNIQYTLTEDGELIPQEYHCYAVWNKCERCANCVSAKSITTKETVTKFEFVNKKVFFVISKYLIVENIEYSLEMVREITDEALFDAYGKSSFTNIMQQFNAKIYKDTLTGAYNRRYYTEQGLQLREGDALVTLDLDHFKFVNDNFGHAAGDLVLKEFTRLIMENIRDSDKLIRMGGDEFIIILRKIPNEILKNKLEQIRQLVEAMRIEEYPEARVTTSIGAVSFFKTDKDLSEIADEMLYIAKKERNTIKIY